ncbi:MAG: anhydro-N-acetylmuramic acid kinase [Bacteroidota bacterium]
MENYKVIGVMSGTSLDGLDVAACQFNHDDGKWGFQIIDAFTFNYPESISGRLAQSTRLSGMELKQLDHDLKLFIGDRVKDFMSTYGFQPQWISTHGHTVFHQPEIGYTLQIGSGYEISQSTGMPVIADFRSLDVSLGGQGAPLVPIGDLLLFPDHPFCLNLGGIGNLSFKQQERIVAFDICAVNMVLDHLARMEGLGYDNEGKLAAQGTVDQQLLTELNQLEFYGLDYPKSLGYEWVEKNVFTLLDKELSTSDILATYVHHIAEQIGNALSSIIASHDFQNKPSILVTGGGTFNQFLMDTLKQQLPHVSFDIPDVQLIKFKEALVFAFLGVLRLRGEANCLSSVTGASHDSCGGIVYDHSPSKVPHS